ncbi:MAG: M23 family metallopeptidase [Actinobacteria bacterium]|nr:M23 family metallopeptidase [Actinomycetota bacterium]
MLATPGGAAATTDNFTPLSAQVLHAPEPVRGGDGREHLAYELVIANDSVFPPHAVTVRKVIVKAAGKVVQTVAGKQLSELMEPFGVATKKTTTIQPGGTAKVLMDVTYPAGAKLPRKLEHELVVSPDSPGSVELSRFPAAPTTVGQHQAMVVAPPLRGPGWVVVNGCCGENTVHRHSLLAINGALHAGERYAIDFIQMTPEGRLTDGPEDVLGSYPSYGDEVLSSTAGKVVGVENSLPDGPIEPELAPPHAGDAGGNHVVVAVGGGIYAFYAHLIPGSVKVAVGQRVKVGEPLGLLGNSGNSNAPHLHFQLMDGPSPLGAEGIPYRFSHFIAEGTLADFPQFFGQGAKAQESGAPRGPRRGQLPLNLQVVDFGQ